MKITYKTKHAGSAMHNDKIQNKQKIQLFEDQVKMMSVLFVRAVVKSYFNLVVFVMIVTSKQKEMKNL